MRRTYRQNKYDKTQVRSVIMTEGMTMEEQIGKILDNQMDVDEKQVIYTERKDGVVAGLDIRTDRFDIALEAMDKGAKSMINKRISKLEIIKEEEEEKDPNGDSIDSTKS